MYYVLNKNEMGLCMVPNWEAIQVIYMYLATCALGIIFFIFSNCALGKHFCETFNVVF